MVLVSFADGSLWKKHELFTQTFSHKPKTLDHPWSIPGALARINEVMRLLPHQNQAPPLTDNTPLITSHLMALSEKISLKSRKKT
jgi:hypothetical protein